MKQYDAEPGASGKKGRQYTLAAGIDEGSNVITGYVPAQRGKYEASRRFSKEGSQTKKEDSEIEKIWKASHLAAFLSWNRLRGEQRLLALAAGTIST